MKKNHKNEGLNVKNGQYRVAKRNRRKISKQVYRMIKLAKKIGFYT
jgi:hypothetical protein